MNQTDDAIQVFRPRGTIEDIIVRKTPGMPRLFASMIGLSLVRPGTLAEDTQLAPVRMVMEGRTMDPDVINRFKEVCGYMENGTAPRQSLVPAPFIQTLFIGLIGKYISSSHFPINPMGLIQVEQSFTLSRPVSVSDSLDLSCALIDMVQTPRGIRTRFDMTATVAGDNAFQGIATYFTRAKHPPAKKGAPAEDIPLPATETFGVAGDTGRRYASVSGDYNPHHLYPWTARLIGFKRAIAHGMWSLARTCAALEKITDYPEAMSVDGAFKLPIFMPASVTLGTERQGSTTRFELRDKAKGVPHLKGQFTDLTS